MDNILECYKDHTTYTLHSFIFLAPPHDWKTAEHGFCKIPILTWHGCVRWSDWLIDEILSCKTEHNLTGSEGCQGFDIKEVLIGWSLWGQAMTLLHQRFWLASSWGLPQIWGCGDGR